ncbi:carbon storage regulator CsrA [Chitinivibrio alkaliphilus]|uniref:Translational regulator CsrA n=1 Tax=Chitinivibrio alkaliphilus ACht1 TaxID=1313304 RepID=U7DEL0_9BACT|nr:carbon storage regulator CsrA [Chitinivibrio alkaliphilus]ERP39371.1 carbon storage regulator [Chitinivibrio alkaliphilus ACht1]
MLVLTRKIDEAIRIGDDIVIKIVQANNNSVKIGIEAPRSVSINREEVYQRIQEENRQALHEAGSKAEKTIKNLADILKNNRPSKDSDQ